MVSQTVYSALAPKPIGSYSQAVIASGMKTIFLSGQIGIDPISGTLISENFGIQVNQAFKNLEAVLQSAGISFSNVVKFNIFLTDMKKFPDINTVMEKLIDAPFPARSVVEVSGLPKEAQFEIDAIAIF